MIGCNEYRELISCRLDGALGAADVSSLEKHLDGCPSCRAYADLLAAVSGASTQVDPPPALLTGVMEGIKTAPRPKKNVLRPVITVAAAAACLAIVIAAVGIPKFTERDDVTMSGGTAPSQYTMGATAPLKTTSAENTYPVKAAVEESSKNADVNTEATAESAPLTESAPQPESAPEETIPEEPSAKASAPSASSSRNTAPGNTAPEKPATPPAPAEQELGPNEEPPSVNGGGGAPAGTEASGSTAPESPDANAPQPDPGSSASTAPESPDTNAPQTGGGAVTETPPGDIPETENTVDETESDNLPSSDSYRATVHINGDLPDILSDYDMNELDDDDDETTEPDDSNYEIIAPADILPDLEDMDYDIEYQDEQSDQIYILYSPD